MISAIGCMCMMNAAAYADETAADETMQLSDLPSRCQGTRIASGHAHGLVAELVAKQVQRQHVEDMAANGHAQVSDV